MRTSLERLWRSLGVQLGNQPGSRRRPRPFRGVETLESRLLLSAWDTDWQYGPPPGAEPPGTAPPYDMHINEPGLSLIECPGEGNVPLNVKTKGNVLKGKARSGNIKGKVKLEGDFTDNRTPNDGDTFSGNVTFKIKTPGGGTITINMQVTGAHAQM